MINISFLCNSGGQSSDGCADATQESRERDLWQGKKWNVCLCYVMIDTRIGIIVELLQDELEWWLWYPSTRLPYLYHSLYV